MKSIVAIFLMVFSFLCATQASYRTQTNTYIFNSKTGDLITVTNATGAQEITHIGDPGSIPDVAFEPSFSTGDTTAYFLNAQKKQIEVIKLPFMTRVKTIGVDDYPRSMKYVGNYLYVTHPASGTVSVIDSYGHERSTIYLGGQFTNLVFHGQYAYTINLHQQTLDIVNLDTNQVTHLPVGKDPRTIAIHGDLGYVVNFQSADISVIDLTKNVVVDTIKVDKAPLDIKINSVYGADKTYGYVTHLGSAGNFVGTKKDIITVVDLTAKKVEKTIEVPTHLNSIVIYQGLGYVVDEFSDKMAVLNLASNTLLATISKPKNETIDFTDMMIYAGSKPMRPIFPVYFNEPVKANLGAYVALMPNAFKLGTLKKKPIPADGIFHVSFNDLYNIRNDFQDHKITGDVALSKVAGKSYGSFNNDDVLWKNMVQDIYLYLLQRIWSGDEAVAKKMVRDFVYLDDPVISVLATYMMEETAALSSSTSSTSVAAPIVTKVTEPKAKKKDKPKAKKTTDKKKTAVTKSAVQPSSTSSTAVQEPFPIKSVEPKVKKTTVKKPKTASKSDKKKKSAKKSKKKTDKKKSDKKKK